MEEVKEFITYLKKERGYSDYTIKNYELDILDFIEYCNNYKLNILMLNHI